jgi:hypothetical protein
MKMLPMKSIFISLSLILSFVLRAQHPTLPEDVKSNIEKRIEYGNTPSIVVGIIDEHGLPILILEQLNREASLLMNILFTNRIN